MKRGQIFTVDLMIALAIIVLAIGLITNAWSWQLEQARSSMEYSKMQQIAIDAAAIRYYNNNEYLGLDEHPTSKPSGVKRLGYILSPTPIPELTCIGSTRGTGNKKVEVFVCREE